MTATPGEGRIHLQSALPTSEIGENEWEETDKLIDSESAVIAVETEKGKMQRGGYMDFWLKKLWLICVCASCMGVQFSYTIQFAIGTPLFNDAFKIPASSVAYILSICGPVSGFIIQPIVCSYSDSAQFRFGRRRPFIVVGTLGCSLAMVLIALSNRIGCLFGDDKDGQSEKDHIVGIILAVTGFVLMNVFVNVIQGPARTLIADLLPEDERDEGNGMISAVMGFSNMLGSAVGAPFTTVANPYEILFLIGAVLLFISMFPTICASREKRFKPTSKRRNPFVDLGKGLVGFAKDRRLWPIVTAYYFSWSAYAPLMIFCTQYFGKDIYNGDPDTAAGKYHTGIKVGMFALALFALVQMVYGFFCEKIQRKVGLSLTYALTQVFATCSYFGLLLFDSLWPAIIFVALTGPNFATFNAVPFTLTQNLVGEERMGLYTGVLNGGSVVAQSVTNLLICSFVVRAANEDVKWGIFVGAPFSVLAILFACMLKERRRTAEEIAGSARQGKCVEDPRPVNDTATPDDEQFVFSFPPVEPE